MALVLGTVHVAQKIMEAPEFEAEVETALPEPELNRFEVGDTPIEPTVLDTESLTQLDAPKMEQTEKVYDDNPSFVEAGGGMASAAVIGMAIPSLLRRLKLDPQVAAGPIALAASDVLTLLIYFNLARWLLA